MEQKHLEFIENIDKYAKKYAPQYDIRVISPIIAQAILESAWGTSDLGIRHNYFGIKCRKNWTGKSYSKVTKEEYQQGVITNITANFCVWDSMEEGVKGYFEFLYAPGVTWYDNLKGVTDPYLYCELIKLDGYATTSNYTQLLVDLIKKYDLTQYDEGVNVAKLFVIPGHGAGDPGAMNGKWSEAERVRALATKIKELGGNNVELADFNRNYYADNGISSLNLAKGTQVIELHMDSAGASARGGHVIISTKFNPDAYDNKLASFIGAMFPGRSNTIVKRSDLANVNRAANKGISYRLLEVCFISNNADLNLFNNDLAGVATGILKAFDVPVNNTTEGWVKNATGWWYRYADGSWPAKQWKQINNEWYYFNDEGYAVTGWLKLENKWYYFNREGEGTECAMVKNTIRNIWGMWYAFNDKGEMIEGSIKIAENGHLLLN